VIEYWEKFLTLDAQGNIDWGATLAQMSAVTEGGLVVYGAVFGATLGLVGFARRHKLNLLALCDLIAPSVILGQAVGRLGCFLNGCCYGGVCLLPWALSFPPDSPPYIDQAGGLVLRGDRIVRINDMPVAKLGLARQALAQLHQASGQRVSIQTASSRLPHVYTTPSTPRSSTAPSTAS
jgi:phosphatidylglycerol:prolipoprotein diacylglycerol transferase